MNRLSLIILLVLSACKRQASETDSVSVKEIVSGVGMIDFDSANGTYMCRAPGEWRALEHPERQGVDTVSFFGPLQGSKPLSVTIGIMKFPIGTEGNKGPEAYAESFWEFTPDANPPKREIIEINGKQVIRFAIERPYVPLHAAKAEYIERWDFALIPVKDGFFRIQHKAPKDAYMKTLPVFEAVVRSFKPKES